MTLTSSVPFAMANLLTVLTAALAPVQTSYAHPGELIEKESVWMQDPVGTETASIGQVSHREEYVIPIVVSVLGEGDDAQTLMERAWVLVGLIEVAVRANPSLSGAQAVTSAVVEGKTPKTFTDPGGRLAEITVAVKVNSRF